jgi:hypothetical protein
MPESTFTPGFYDGERMPGRITGNCRRRVMSSPRWSLASDPRESGIFFPDWDIGGRFGSWYSEGVFSGSVVRYDLGDMGSDPGIRGTGVVAMKMIGTNVYVARSVTEDASWL